MTNSKQSYKMLSIILVIISIGAIIYLLNSSLAKTPQTSSQPTPSNSASSREQSSSESLQSVKYLILAQRSQGSTDIFIVNSQDKSKKTIYTDKDENEKIKSLGNITSTGKILALMAPKDSEFVGTLYLIKTDGSGQKEKLVENFASASSPLISPDGQKICYTLFSNAEADYGFGLIVANMDNSNKREIAKNSTSLAIYSWDQDSKNIYYSKAQGQNNTPLYSYNLTNNDEQLLSSLDGYVHSLSSSTNDKFVLSMSPDSSKFAQSEIYLLENKKLLQVTHDENYDDYPHLSRDNFIGYAAINYLANQSVIYLPGKIKEISSQGKNQVDLVEGNFVIGWLE